MKSAAPPSSGLQLPPLFVHDTTLVYFGYWTHEAHTCTHDQPETKTAISVAALRKFMTFLLSRGEVRAQSLCAFCDTSIACIQQNVCTVDGISLLQGRTMWRHPATEGGALRFPPEKVPVVAILPKDLKSGVPPLVTLKARVCRGLGWLAADEACRGRPPGFLI